MKREKYTVVSLFSGGMGLDIGIEQTGRLPHSLHSVARENPRLVQGRPNGPLVRWRAEQARKLSDAKNEAEGHRPGKGRRTLMAKHDHQYFWMNYR